PSRVVGFVRVDQLGFAPGETKVAYLLASAPVRGAAYVVVDEAGRTALHGRAGVTSGRWNARYPAVHPLDLTPLYGPGTYRIRFEGSVHAVSPPFRIGNPASLFGPRIADAVAFFQAQRDGADVIPGPLARRRAHLHDRGAVVYAWPRYRSAGGDVILGRSLQRIARPVDLEGGWMDAGDFLKLTHTTAYAEVLLLAARRTLGDGAPAALAAELATAASLFASAKTRNVHQGDVVTALPHAFYPESSWRDDLELAAAELALAGQALGDPRQDDWLHAAADWARTYLAREAGRDTLNLYDTSAVAHADLVRAIRAAGRPAGLAVSEAKLLADLSAQLRRGLDRASHDPFGAGAVYDDFDAAPHTFGLVVTARLYDDLTSGNRYEAFATSQRGWALGANAWGASLQIGVGRSFPRCPQHVVANLSGRLDGRPPFLRGAVVN